MLEMDAHAMPETAKIVECPRDALQGCPRLIPAALKADLLRALLRAGLRHLDAVSFVSPAAVPQMADAEEVLQRLGEIPADAEIIAIVLNRRGLERAIASGRVTTIGFPYSVSPTFQRRNANQTPEQARATLADLKSAADAAGLRTLAYISMAFGNPYGDEHAPALVLETLDFFGGIGIGEVALADTVGLAPAAAIHELFAAARARVPEMEIGLHLHAPPAGAAAQITAAWRAGCRRFDAAVGGLGGCPFAGDDLVGNLATETLLTTLTDLGARPQVNLAALAPAEQIVQRIRQQYCS